ncbi:hypothetical protein AX16_005103 [Volvariella volvacea WC 439]|nr:hypothetical protein AX16_005103 [Volvariella volvacea WC 439]
MELYASLAIGIRRQHLFRGTLTVPSDSTPQADLPSSSPREGFTRLPVVVKLVARHQSYGSYVQQCLARHGFVPRLYKESVRPGAPTAYIMQDLGSNWITLFELSKKYLLRHRVGRDTSGIVAAKEGIEIAMQEILEVMESDGVVHGNLRPNNIMIQVEDIVPVLSELRENSGRKRKGELAARLKVIDFDWAGKAGEVWYTPCRNEVIGGIEWPGIAGGLIEAGHDRVLVESWPGEFLTPTQDLS